MNDHYAKVEAFQSLLKGLDDEGLAQMNSALLLELDSRITAKINAGNFEPPSPEQLIMYQKESKIKAIVAYRWGKDVSLLFAKRLFEKLT